MMNYNVEKVFGVSNEMIESYIEREKVDDLFIQGLKSNKHIIIFGSSKQGKTALTTKHLEKTGSIRVNCSPESKPEDLYRSVLRQLGIEFKEVRVKGKGTDSAFGGSLKANVKIPLVAKAEAEARGQVGFNKEEQITYKTIEYNLSLPQDISEILQKTSFGKRIILENFHYLDESTQKDLAFHLRVFEDYNILFVILGIWREKNRLSQFNGDLQDRVVEIPVEPWEKSDFVEVLKKGERLLNVEFKNIADDIIQQSFDSIGVFQELCKNVCLKAGVQNTCDSTFRFTDEHLKSAIVKKVEDYSGRHIRSIETFIEQRVKTTDKKPLHIPYYFINILLKEDFGRITRGLKRKYIENKIKAIHHRKDDVRPSDTSYFLHNITRSQINKKIMPPLFDYDRSTRTLTIIDSTLYFFLRNTNIEELLDELEIPEDINIVT